MVNTLSSPVQNQVSNWKFVETWIDPTSEIPYVLLLLLADEAGEYKVYDPKVIQLSFPAVATTMRRIF
jgi:hypothetical protein